MDAGDGYDDASMKQLMLVVLVVVRQDDVC